MVIGIANRVLGKICRQRYYLLLVPFNSWSEA